MTLAFANMGEEMVIRKIGGNPELKKHLKNLGFVAGSRLTVVSTLGSNMIVNVKGSRVAISGEMARKILI